MQFGQYEVIGIRRAERTSKKTGNKYIGVNLFCTYESQSVEGLGTESFFATAANVPPEVHVGSIIRPYYNRFGSIESFEVVA